MSLASQVSLLATRIGQEIKAVKASIPGVAAPIVLTDATTIATNAALGDRFRVTIAGSRTLGAPTNPRDGQVVTWEVTTSGASRLLTLLTTAGGFAGATRLPVMVRSGTVTFIRATYVAAISKWWVDTPELFGEKLYAASQSERDGYATSFGYAGMEVVRTDKSGTAEWWDGSVWHSNASPAPAIVQSTAANGGSTANEIVWASATIADPGYVYRIEVGARIQGIFVNSGTRVLLRARAGLSGTADTALGEVGNAMAENNDTVGVITAIPPFQTQSSFSGAGRVAFTAQRTVGTGNWDIAANGFGYYRIVPA